MGRVIASQANIKLANKRILKNELQFHKDPDAFYGAMEGILSYGFTREDILNSVENDMLLSAQARREKSLYVNLFYDLSWVYMDRAKHNISAPEEMLLMYIERAKTEPIYRIEINEDHTVQTTCYELLDAFDPALKNCYETLDDLPNWVQDKLAVLMLLDHKKVNEEVKGVGRRISKNVYWVFHGETDGSDPRGES